MTDELGLNLAGVERVLELEQQLERARRRIEALERRTAELQAEMQASSRRSAASTGPSSCRLSTRGRSSAWEREEHGA